LPTIGLAWDSVTLRAIPTWVMEKCARDNLNPTEMYLSPDDLEPATPRDSRRDVELAQAEIEERFGWLSIGPEGERIQAVVNSADSTNEWRSWILSRLI
jgi:hypothetical protein